jgi:hypothetical protein
MQEQMPLDDFGSRTSGLLLRDGMYIQRLNFEEGTMMFRRSIFAGAALVALCTAIPIAFASPPTTVTFADNFAFMDSCNGDMIHFVGTMTVTTASSVQNDIAHVQIHVTKRDDGTGSLGSYKTNADLNLEQNIKLVNFTGEQNIVLIVNVIGKGATANEQIKESIHLTVNAQGTVTVSRSDASMTCHG